MPNLLIKEIIAPVCIVAGAVVLYVLFSKMIRRLFRLRFGKVDPKKGKTLTSLINSILKYFIGILALLMILDVFGIDTKSLLASLGVVALVVGLALQDILKDFISGMFIIFENQYGVGDTVTISGFKGEIQSLGLKTTKIKAYTGEVKIISNRMVTEVINHSLENSLAIAEVNVSYDTDLTKLDQVLEKLCGELNKKLEHIIGSVEIWGIDDLGSSGILIKLAVSTDPMEQYGVRRKMLRELKIALQQAEIEIPYPQVVIRHG